MMSKIKSNGIKISVLNNISVVTSLGLQSYSEARLMFATAKGTIISIKSMPCTNNDKSVKESMNAVAKGTMTNFWLNVPNISLGCNSLMRMPCRKVPSKKSCKTIPA